MSTPQTIYPFENIARVANKLRTDLDTKDFVLLYAYNGTGKTRISMAFKDEGKANEARQADTLYFNAFTEDLFHWDNDLPNDTERVLQINAESSFFAGFRQLALEERIFKYLERYATFNYKIDYDNWTVRFYKEGSDFLKISRGEETAFIWCIFIAICELVIEGAEAYKWVKYIYIDDPISSLDDNNAIAMASDLAKVLVSGISKVKMVISSHHNLFFNVMFNELKKYKCKRYFLHKYDADGYTLRDTKDSPYFHHIAVLSELEVVVASDSIKTYHFNMLRTILEKTAAFFGSEDFSKCIIGMDNDEALFSRALNLLSHGSYSIFEPVEMGDDNKELFKRIFAAFLDKYEFHLPEILNETNP